MGTLLSMFRRIRPRPHPGTLTASAGNDVETTLAQAFSLCDLPVEILQHITSFLPISSAASLARSNKKICRVIGTQYWQILKDSRQANCEDEMFQFLSLLEQDYPQYLVCYRCNALHLRSPLDLPPTRFARRRRHNPRDCELQDGEVVLNDYAITMDYRHLQLAMKSHRNAANFGPMSDALSHSFIDHVRSMFSVSISQRALVVADELFIEQRWTLEQNRASDILQDLDYSLLHICCHVLSFRDAPLAELLACKLGHPDQSACPRCSGGMLSNCQYCPTDIDLRVWSTNNVTTVKVIAWRNLGSFRTPMDPKWLVQRQIPSDTTLPKDWRRPFDYEAGSVRRAFETQLLRTLRG